MTLKIVGTTIFIVKIIGFLFYKCSKEKYFNSQKQLKA